MDRALRELVWRRAGNCCEYCRMPREYDDTTFEIDHVIATSHGGPTRAANLCLACFACNSFKCTNLSFRDVKTQKTVSLFNPPPPQVAPSLPLGGPAPCGPHCAGPGNRRDLAHQSRPLRSLPPGAHRQGSVPARLARILDRDTPSDPGTPSKTQGHRRAMGAREAAQAGQASPPWRVRLSSNVG